MTPDELRQAGVRVRSIFHKLDHGLQLGDEVLVAGQWYPVIGYVGMHHPDGGLDMEVFTNKPIGKYEAWLGYRVGLAMIEDCRRPALEPIND